MIKLKDMKDNKVLVVIDCQNDFIDGSLANEEAQKKVPNIVKKINEFDGSCIFVTQDTHGENYLKTTEGEHLPVEHCIRGTKGWEINEDVKKALDEAEKRNISVYYIEKPTFGSYELTNRIYLELEKYGSCEVEFVGFCTDICVVSNALLLKAALFETGKIKVDASCCAGVTPESHNAALLTMKMCHIEVEGE